MTPHLATDRLVLAPLRVADAEAMAPVLADPDLYAFTGGSPPDVPALRARYRSQVAGPADGSAVWHNWIIRLVDQPVGFVQATVVGTDADVAWVIGTPWQRLGIASEASACMCAWLRTSGVQRITAHVHPAHVASQVVAERLGLHDTGVLDDEGEAVWADGA